MVLNRQQSCYFWLRLPQIALVSGFSGCSGQAVLVCCLVQLHPKQLPKLLEKLHQTHPKRLCPRVESLSGGLSFRLGTKALRMPHVNYRGACKQRRQKKEVMYASFDSLRTTTLDHVGGSMTARVWNVGGMQMWFVFSIVVVCSGTVVLRSQSNRPVNGNPCWCLNPTGRL
jgi:hypothetical protein